MTKQCKGCATTLNNWKERLSGYCPQCAAAARQGFAKMGRGDFKEGLKEVITLNPKVSKEEQEATEKLLSNAVKKKRKKIEKKLRKKGLSEEEIKAGLDKFTA